MAKLIALDDGHGIGTPGKRTPYIPSLGRQVMENEFNREVVKYLDIELRRCGFQTLLTAPTDADTPLSERIALANNTKPNGFGRPVDLFLSIHYNAYDGKFDGEGKDPEGFSVHIYPGAKDARRFAEILIRHLSKGRPQKNRGIVEQNLAVTRETTMTAVLSENGFMDNEKEALWMVDPDFHKEVAREHAMAVCEYFGVPYVPEVVDSEPAPKTSEKTPILGESKATLEQMVAFVKAVNPSFNPEIAKAYLEISKKYGVRGDIAFCQAIHETGYFKFGGDVKPEQNNFAGLGATGGVPGHSFATIEKGVTAVIQHLFAYASTADLPEGETLVDPRFKYVVQRGKAPNWEDLGGKWAVPGYDRNKYASFEEAYNAGATYGQSILKLYDKLLQVKVEPPKSNKTWKELGLEWLQRELKVSDIWKPEDPIDIGTLGEILKRFNEKIEKG